MGAHSAATAASAAAAGGAAAGVQPLRRQRRRRRGQITSPSRRSCTALKAATAGRETATGDPSEGLKDDLKDIAHETDRLLARIAASRDRLQALKTGSEALKALAADPGIQLAPRESASAASPLGQTTQHQQSAAPGMPPALAPAEASVSADSTHSSQRVWPEAQSHGSARLEVPPGASLALGDLAQFPGSRKSLRKELAESVAMATSRADAAQRIDEVEALELELSRLAAELELQRTAAQAGEPVPRFEDLERATPVVAPRQGRQSMAPRPELQDWARGELGEERLDITPAVKAAVEATIGAGKEPEEEDITSRLRFILPLVPLATVPLLQAKEKADRSAQLLATTLPPGSLPYSTLGWSPPIDSLAYDAMVREFPRSLPAQSVFERSRLFLTQNYGMTPDNTILGTSICPDEINNLEGGVASLAKKYWGEVFTLGGLGGLPSVGKTGWGAFSHHVPEDGNIFVVYGPHVGISDQGEVGKYNRKGQNEETSACGAFVGAYRQTTSWTGEPEQPNSSDAQQQFIRAQLGPLTRSIAETSSPMTALALKAFEIVDRQLETIVDLDALSGNGRLVLLGGIQVNTPRAFPDHFQPMRFEIWQKDKPRQDVLYKAFLPAMPPDAALSDIVNPR